MISLLWSDPLRMCWLAGVGDLPSWLQQIWPKCTYLCSSLRSKYDRGTEDKLRNLLARSIPDFSPDLLHVNYDSADLHMSFLREALKFREIRWFKRAAQFGGRHSSYPLLFVWKELSSELRKFVIFKLVTFELGNPASSLQLLPCSLLTFVDFLEWLPSAGIRAGWSSIRHYAGQLSTFSHVCGFGSIIDVEPTGYNVWQENFSANCEVSTQPRGGDLPLRPWYLRRLIKVYGSNSAFDKMMLSTYSHLWFTALRVGHFSPESRSENHMKHMVEWAHVQPYQAFSCGAPRPANHFLIDSAKNRQKETAETWSTATCCICEGADVSDAEFADLTAICPVCSLERWRQVAPRDAKFICCNPSTGHPILRSAFNKELRRALNLALDYIPASDRAKIVKQLSSKSFRSGAATAIVTAGNAGFVAAAFLGHSDPKITKQYYHKSDDSERLQVAPALVACLRGPAVGLGSRSTSASSSRRASSASSAVSFPAADAAGFRSSDVQDAVAAELSARAPSSVSDSGFADSSLA